MAKLIEIADAFSILDVLDAHSCYYRYLVAYPDPKAPVIWFECEGCMQMWFITLATLRRCGLKSIQTILNQSGWYDNIAVEMRNEKIFWWAAIQLRYRKGTLEL